MSDILYYTGSNGRSHLISEVTAEQMGEKAMAFPYLKSATEKLAREQGTEGALYLAMKAELDRREAAYAQKLAEDQAAAQGQ